MNLSPSILLFAVIVGYPALAQENISLSNGDIQQLGIEFSTVANLDLNSGSRFPATVVISPNANSTLNSTFSGSLEQWFVNPGDVLNLGDPVAAIRSSSLLEIQNRWLLHSSTAEQALIDFERDQQLFDQGIISAQRLERTNRALQLSEIELNSAQVQLSQSGFRPESLNQLLNGGADLGVYQLRSQSSGVLTHRMYSAGEIVPAYSELASIQQNQRAWLAADIPARLAAQLKPDFRLSLEGTGEHLLLRQKDLVVDESTQTVEILAEFDDVVPYMPGQILTLLLPPVGNGVLIPASAVVRTGNTTTVYVQTGMGVEARHLKLEPAGLNYLARTDITAGEKIVVQGAALIKGMQLGLGETE